MPDIEVLYEDNHLIAFSKPAGMLVQGDDTGDLSLLDYGKDYLKDKYNKPGNVYLGLVHRLDRPASGVVLFARTSKAASRLSDQFRRKTTEKLYRIVVLGTPEKKCGTLKHFLVPAKGVGGKTLPGRPGVGKESVLHYEVIKSKAGLSEIKVQLETGRKHQIRAQFSAVGCPVVGDFRYGSKTKLHGGRAIALHAESLCVKHPTKDEKITITSVVPSYWPTDSRAS